MTPEIQRDRRHIFLGAGLGVYAAAIAVAPGVGMKAALSIPLVMIPLAWWILGSFNRWLTLFFLAALILPPLPVALGDSGPHVALLFAGAGVLMGLIGISAWRVAMDALAVSLLTLFAILLGSVAMAAIYSGFLVAAGSLARVALFGISIYVFLYVRSGPGLALRALPFSTVRLLFGAAAASALFACVDFYYQFPAPAGYGPQFIWLDSGVFRRAQGFFYEASTLGNLCACFLLMIAVALFRPRQERPLPAAALLAGGAALAAALVLSYSRASLVNLGAGLTVLVWLHRKRIRPGKALAGATILGCAAALILARFFAVFAEAYWLRISASTQYLTEAPNMVLSGRIASWTRLLDFLLAHPWHLLLGVGYKTLPYSDFIGATAIADNTYLSMLAETGVLGLAAVIAMNVAILTAARRASHHPNPQRSFCGTWMLCFWTGQAVQMLSADLLTYWRVLPVYFCILALAAGGASHEDALSRSVQ